MFMHLIVALVAFLVFIAGNRCASRMGLPESTDGDDAGKPLFA